METNTKDKLSLFQKLHKIMTEVGYLKKDKRNDFQKYNYLSEEQVKTKLHELFVKHGIIFTVNVIDMDVQRVVSGGKDKATTGISVEYAFTDTDTAYTLDGTFTGYGEDAGDKGLYKAITGAIKYILTTTFLIPTGDDAEKHSEEHKTTPQASKPAYYGPASIKKALDLIRSTTDVTELIEMEKKCKASARYRPDDRVTVLAEILAQTNKLGDEALKVTKNDNESQ